MQKQLPRKDNPRTLRVVFLQEKILGARVMDWWKRGINHAEIITSSRMKVKKTMQYNGVGLHEKTFVRMYVSFTLFITKTEQLWTKMCRVSYFILTVAREKRTRAQEII